MQSLMEKTLLSMDAFLYSTSWSSHIILVLSKGVEITNSNDVMSGSSRDVLNENRVSKRDCEDLKQTEQGYDEKSATFCFR